MIEGIIKNIQKFINKPFLKSELETCLDKQKNLLMQNILRETKEEYNAIWDTLFELDMLFQIPQGYACASYKLSVNNIYIHNLKIRKEHCLSCKDDLDEIIRRIEIK